MKNPLEFLFGDHFQERQDRAHDLDEKTVKVIQQLDSDAKRMVKKNKEQKAEVIKLLSSSNDEWQSISDMIAELAGRIQR